MLMDLLMISVITCFIIDVSGIIESIENMMGKWLGGKVVIPKPFSCSLCMCFWVCLIWLAVQSQFTLFNIMMVCMISALTEQISNGIIIIKQFIASIEDKIQLLITKIE